jgi:hypothetical protein
MSQPDCGTDVLGYQLLDPYLPGVDDSSRLSNMRGEHGSNPHRLVAKAFMWLPEFYIGVLVGDMRVLDYLRGGPVCRPRGGFTLPKVRVTIRD